MPSLKTLEAFIARVEQNAHVEAIAEFYSETATMQENQAAPRQGRALLIAHEQQVMAKVRSVRSQCLRPALVQGDTVVIRWRFEFEWLNGRKSQIEELAYQRWQGEQIAQEQFFYDPAQMGGS